MIPSSDLGKALNYLNKVLVHPELLYIACSKSRGISIYQYQINIYISSYKYNNKYILRFKLGTAFLYFLSHAYKKT